MRPFFRQIALALVLGAGLVLFFLRQDTVFAALEWVRQQGALGMIGYGLIYVLATVSVAPGLALAMGAGFIYGPVLGLCIIVPASVIGGMAAFFLGRTYLRNLVTNKLVRWPHYPKFDRAISENGFWFIVLLFAYPLTPFRILSYIISLTNFSAKSFALVLLISMTLHMIPYVYCGSLACDLAEARNQSIFELIFHSPYLCGGIFFSLVTAFVVFFWCYRRFIKQI